MQSTNNLLFQFSTEGFGWTNAGVCSPFTQCSDYSVTLDKGYQYQDKSCIPGVVNNGTVQFLLNRFPKNINYSARIFLIKLFVIQDFYKIQVSNAGGLEILVLLNKLLIVQASPIANCVNIMVVYTLDKHELPHIKSESTCTKLVAENTSQIQVCTWSDGVCKDLDTGSLTYTTCYTQSYGTYTRQGKTCQACTGQASSSMFQLVILFILMIQ